MGPGVSCKWSDWLGEAGRGRHAYAVPAHLWHSQQQGDGTGHTGAGVEPHRDRQRLLPPAAHMHNCVGRLMR